MKIKIVSDFHTEFFTCNNPPKFARILDKYFPETPDDKETVLCCAGDMGTYNTYSSSYKPLFKLLGERFREVIVVPGNHSWYDSTGIWGNEGRYREGWKLPKNVNYLDNAVKVIDGVAFIGSCLWTNFYGADPIAMWDASRQMNDFQCIKIAPTDVYSRGRTLSPGDTIIRHGKSRAFTESQLLKYNNQPVVVVTHHAPSEQSVANIYRGDRLNAAYYTDLTRLIEDTSPTLWCHGHMHDSKDYMIGDTRVLCNPLGYHPSQLNRGFNPDLVVEV